MQLDFLNVLFTVLFLVILVVPGFILVKTKILDKSAEKVVSSLVLYMAQPMLIFASFQKQAFSSEILTNILICAGVTALVHIIMIVLVFLFIRGKEPRHNCLRTASVFANCGYMGIPFLQLLFTGSEAGEVLIYGAVIISVFNIFNWSVGIFMISGDKKNINIKNILLNPTILSIFVGLFVFVIAKKPLVDLAVGGSTLDMVLEKFMKSVNYLADMVTPLAMMVIGLKLGNMDLKKLFNNKYVYFACFNKLIIMSLVSILVVAFLPLTDIVKYTIFFTLSMPSATSTVLFAVKFGGDGEMASTAVLLSTLLSIISIPIMFELFKLLI